jgi:hypothetical protein
MLWVLEANPARGWYERLGGQEVGIKDWGGDDEFGTRVREVAYGWPCLGTLVASVRTSLTIKGR